MSNTRIGLRALALAAALGELALPCGAQTPVARWRWSVAPYSWLSGTGGTIGVRDLTASNSKSVGDVLSQLEFAAMGVVEGGYGVWGAYVDAMYVSLGDQKVVAIAGDTGTFSLDQKLTMIQPTGLWTVASGTWGGVDVLGGARFWNLDFSATTDRSGRSRATSRSLWDGFGGLRFRALPADRWHAIVDGNIGAGASKFTWEAQGYAAYDIATYWALSAGYRYLHMKLDERAARITGRMSGFVVGFAYRQ
jgi:hypothetical protein